MTGSPARQAIIRHHALILGHISNKDFGPQDKKAIIDLIINAQKELDKCCTECVEHPWRLAIRRFKAKVFNRALLKKKAKIFNNK